MSTLRAILELQGSLDTAVTATRDARVAEIADSFLPGSSTNPHWYREIEAFMFPGGDDAPEDERARTEADPDRALRELFAETESPRPTAPEASRLMYALGAVIHLTRTVPPEVELPFADPIIERAGDIDNLLSLIGPGGQRRPASSDGAQSDTRPRVTDLVDVFVNELNGWQDWPKVAQTLTQMQILSAEVAAVPLCVPSVVTVDGIESVVVDTEFTSTEVSLNAVKEVVDPNNWDDNYPSFFCKMQYQGLRTDGWRRVLETVGFCSLPYSRRLRTMLKYYKSAPSATEARLDYDLNDPVPDPLGDGQITVDRGFINMWAPQGKADQPPVTVRTRKVAHITGLRPYTMARFVCAFGYAYAAMEMILGSAKDPTAIADRRPWQDAPETAGDSPDGSDQAKADPKPHPQNSVASTTITMVAQCVEEVTVKQFDLADKWMSGKLTVDDLAKHSAELGARIASEPFRIMAAIAKGAKNADGKGAGK